jgi:hypothetical protein
MRSALFAGPVTLGAVFLVAVCNSEPAAASEGGSSFYLLGSGSPGAAIAPPIEGVFFNNTTYVYQGEADASRQFVIGGNVVAGIDATAIADFASLIWVPSPIMLPAFLHHKRPHRAAKQRPAF